MATYLKLGLNKTQVDTIDISDVEISYSLLDIRNYGKRNSSFTKPIAVLRTPTSESIFKGLFNINSINFDITKKIYAEIVENGIVILKGNLQVVEVTSNTYEVVVSSNNLSLFELLGDELIVGNTNSVNDIAFVGEIYETKYDVSTIRNSLRQNPANNGNGIMFPIIDYSNTLNTPTDIEENYPITPAIAVRQLFDKIFHDASYSYTVTDDISTLLNKMYIPVNTLYYGINANSVSASPIADVSYGLYFLGDPIGDAYTDAKLKLDASSYYNTEFGNIPSGCFRGFCFDFTGSGGTGGIIVSGGKDTIHNYPSDYHQTSSRMELPVAGSYLIDVSISVNLPWISTLRPTVNTPEDTVAFYFTVHNDIENTQTIEIRKDILLAHTVEQITQAVEITVKKKSSLYINMTSANYPGSNIGIQDAYVIAGPNTFMKIKLLNYAYGNDISININSILPTGYKKVDLVTDIFKIFNAIIEVDDEDPYKLIISSYASYYTNLITKDWSSKVDTDNIKFKSIKNEFPSITLSYTSDTDIYNEDYKSKSNVSFGGITILNDSDFVSTENNIQLVAAATIMKKISD